MTYWPVWIPARTKEFVADAPADRQRQACRHDMAGRHGQSWRSRIEEAGFLCRTDVRGLADADSFVELWMERLAAVLRSFDDTHAGPAGQKQGVCS